MYAKTPPPSSSRFTTSPPDEKTGTLTFSGGKILGNPAMLQLPAFGKIELPLKFTPEWNHQSRGELRIEGVFNGRKSSPLVAPLVNFSKLISSSKQKPLSGSSNPASWRQNSSGTMKIAFDSGESAIRFDVRFAPHADRWVYPEYTLQLPQESLEGSSARRDPASAASFVRRKACSGAGRRPCPYSRIRA